SPMKIGGPAPEVGLSCASVVRPAATGGGVEIVDGGVGGEVCNGGAGGIAAIGAFGGSGCAAAPAMAPRTFTSSCGRAGAISVRTELPNLRIAPSGSGIG